MGGFIPVISTVASVASGFKSLSGGGKSKSSSPGPAPTTDSVALEAEKRRKEAAANAIGRGSTIATTPFNQQIAGAVQRKSLLGE